MTKERLKVIRGDITEMAVDAIVNAANKSLRGGGGVDGAIHAKAGPGLLAECRTLGGCETGQATLTNGYNLPADYVIHTVGPVWQGGQCGEDDLLERCYRNSLGIALKRHLDVIVFPAISTGIFGFPTNRAATIAVRATREFIRNSDYPRVVIFCCFDKQTYDAYQKVL